MALALMAYDSFSSWCLLREAPLRGMIFPWQQVAGRPELWVLSKTYVRFTVLFLSTMCFPPSNIFRIRSPCQRHKSRGVQRVTLLYLLYRPGLASIAFALQLSKLNIERRKDTKTLWKHTQKLSFIFKSPLSDGCTSGQVDFVMPFPSRVHKAGYGSADKILAGFKKNEGV